MQYKFQNRSKVDHALTTCLSRQVHFAAYKLPGDNPVTLIIQKDPEIKPIKDLNQKLPDKGFLIVPFSTSENDTYLIKPDIIFRESSDIADLETLNQLPARLPCSIPGQVPPETFKTHYLDLISQSIEKIDAGDFEKVVLSRVKPVDGHFSAELSAVFLALCETYPHAFVYLFHVQGQCWTGASPEPFVYSTKDSLNTVSLAGTRPFSNENLDIDNWNHKEKQEQEYVTRYIERTLNNYGVTTYSLKGPFIARAGNLIHLRTDFAFSAAALGSRLPSLIHTLHPTPAICGMPAESALNFIRNHENYNREYYTGFLGPVGIDDLLQLFVNLRCMKVLENKLILYTGSGITDESNPEDEWEETEIKADTILAVLNKIK
ncbi:MAG: isochorismate synthase [Bacteroidales bacterium]|nr:isochorismate synthase [Bacteroidales bacterium]